MKAVVAKCLILYDSLLEIVLKVEMNLTQWISFFFITAIIYGSSTRLIVKKAGANAASFFLYWNKFLNIKINKDIKKIK